MIMRVIFSIISIILRSCNDYDNDNDYENDDDYADKDDYENDEDGVQSTLFLFQPESPE